MPDDVGGRPFPDGDEPDSHRSHGAADEEFASVVFDEDFVRSARIHEPTAAERMLAAAQARAEAEAARARAGSGPADDEFYDDGYGPGGDPDFYRDDIDGFGRDADDDGYGPYGRYGGSLRPYRSPARWHRPVAWVLAVLMGIGMVALAFAAVYRGAAGSRQEPAPPPATSGVDGPKVGQLTGQPGVLPSASADSAAPTVSAAPRAH
ncbi:SCO2584 family spore wall biosynthesis protein [Streptomyces sp. 8N706]|uniref:SCO2584 family spore wall biosynthesis protein n=1 Tax=Streptomyces sp. 8N706 TaxID=3457416 RepID=UPI003FD136F8